MNRPNDEKAKIGRAPATTICSPKKIGDIGAQRTLRRDRKANKDIKFLIREFVCIPIKPDDKIPTMKWKTLRKSPELSHFEKKNIAIKTGLCSQIIVIDIDLPKDKNDGMIFMEELLRQHNNSQALSTPICITQSGGLHMYFKYDSMINTGTGLDGYSIDIRSDGGYVVAPPSVGKLGPYKWMDDHSIYDLEPMHIPDWLKAWIIDAQKEKTKPKTITVDKAVFDSPKQSDTCFYIYDAQKLTDSLRDLPSRYCDNFQDWFVVTSCLKADDLYDIWDDWSAKSDSYDKEKNFEIWNVLRPKLDMGYLSYIFNKNEIPNPIHKTRYDPDLTDTNKPK